MTDNAESFGLDDDFDYFPNVLDSNHTSFDSFPRGPDYAALDEVIGGLAKQSLQYRTQWRKRHGKEPSNDMAKPPIAAGEETPEVYLRCGVRLRNRYIRIMAPGMSPDDMSAIPFVDWLWSLRPLLDDDTWRFYRAGAERVILSLPSSGVEEGLAWLYADLHVAGDRRARATDHKRVSRMDETHFEKLMSELRTKKSKIARELEVWLLASVHTGLHPAQWRLSSVEKKPDAAAPRGERIWLHVVMGHIQARWLTHRTLDISQFSEATLQAIAQMIENARNWARDRKFASHQAEVSRLLRETSKRLFRRAKLRYDLHGLRYQCIDNLKSIYSDSEVAALTGEICWEKPRRHYINRRPGWTEITEKPVASARLVHRMQKRLEIRHELKELTDLKNELKRLRDDNEAPLS